LLKSQSESTIDELRPRKQYRKNREEKVSALGEANGTLTWQTTGFSIGIGARLKRGEERREEMEPELAKKNGRREPGPLKNSLKIQSEVRIGGGTSGRGPHEMWVPARKRG